MAKAAVFNERLRVFIDRSLSPEAQSRHLAVVAKRERDQMIAAGRASPRYRRFVDGVEGAAEEAVRPADGGRIVYRFGILGPVCTFALSFLINRSPARSGIPLNPATGKTAHFRDGFYFGITEGVRTDGGKFVPAAQFDPALLTATVTQVVIGNMVPYSRKVDVQLIGLKSLSFSVDPGLFDDAVKQIRARFGSVVSVKRVWTMDFPGQYILRNRQVWTTGKRAGRTRKRQGTRVESPAIIITPLR